MHVFRFTHDFLGVLPLLTYRQTSDSHCHKCGRDIHHYPRGAVRG